MRAAGQYVTPGDHIPYVICEPKAGAEHTGGLAERAYHPDEVRRSGGVLKPDHMWYLATQIHPPVRTSVVCVCVCVCVCMCVYLLRV